jgi:hypothetical protein
MAEGGMYAQFLAVPLMRTPLIRAVRTGPLPRHLTTSIGSSTYSTAEPEKLTLAVLLNVEI